MIVAHKLAQLYLRAFPEDPHPFTEADFTRYNESAYHYLAIIGDETNPTGAIVAQVVLEEAEILTVFVDPEQQRQGHGDRLLRMFLEAMTEQAVPHIFLDVRADNITAQRLYKRHGFRVAGRRKGYYRVENQGIDGLVMVRNGADL